MRTLDTVHTMQTAIAEAIRRHGVRATSRGIAERGLKMSPGLISEKCRSILEYGHSGTFTAPELSILCRYFGGKLVMQLPPLSEISDAKKGPWGTTRLYDRGANWRGK